MGCQHFLFKLLKFKCIVQSWNSRWCRLMDINVTYDIHSVKRLGTRFMLHTQPMSSLLTFKWLVNIHLSILQHTLSSSETLHLYRSATGYFICYLCSSSMSWILTAKFLYLLAAAIIYYIYIYAFIRRFYPKWLTLHLGYTFCISMCSPWESNPHPLRC